MSENRSQEEIFAEIQAFLDYVNSLNLAPGIQREVWRYCIFTLMEKMVPDEIGQRIERASPQALIGIIEAMNMALSTYESQQVQAMFTSLASQGKDGKD